MNRIDEISTLSSVVREACETIAFDKVSEKEYYHRKEDLGGMCAIASMALLNALHAKGITDAKFIYGYFNEFGMESHYISLKKRRKESNHCWIEFNKGLIIDITISQFSNWTESKLYIGKRTKFHHPIYVYNELNPNAIVGSGQVWLTSQVKKKALSNKILKIAGIKKQLKRKLA